MTVKLSFRRLESKSVCLRPTDGQTATAMLGADSHIPIRQRALPDLLPHLLFPHPPDVLPAFPAVAHGDELLVDVFAFVERARDHAGIDAFLLVFRWRQYKTPSRSSGEKKGRG